MDGYAITCAVNCWQKWEKVLILPLPGLCDSGFSSRRTFLGRGGAASRVFLDAMRATLSGFTRWGAPAAVVPVGRSPEGLPIGVQIVGRPFEDERVLGIAAAVEGSFGYKPPPLSII